jgi:hypothetical protein
MIASNGAWSGSPRVPFPDDNRGVADRAAPEVLSGSLGEVGEAFDAPHLRPPIGLDRLMRLDGERDGFG